MRKFLAVAALMATSAALAQAAPVTPPAPPAPIAHPMADKVMTRADVVAMVRDHFTRLDANKDGAVTTVEIGESHTKWGEYLKQMGGAPGELRHGGPIGDPNAAFDRLDINEDGVISRDEFAKGREQRIERRMVMREEGAKDGKSSGKRTHRMGGMGGAQMIVMADTNKDGRITLAEAEALALQHFDEMDTNHDGQVTPEERRAARPMMIKRMQAPSAG